MRALLTLFLALLAGAAAVAQQPPSESPAPAKPAVGQEQSYPAKPEATAQAAEMPHRFWDTKNKSLFAGVLAARMLDFASTKNMRARGRDEILLTNEIVDNTPAFVAIELGGAALSVGVSYWLHRKNHHKLERWVSIVHIGVTTFGAARNYMLETRRPTPAAFTLVFRH